MENKFLTVLEIAQTLGISSVAANKRLERKEIKPFRYIGSAGLYREADLEAIRDAGARGRPKTSRDAPKAAGKSKAAPKTKPKKPAKKT